MDNEPYRDLTHSEACEIVAMLVGPLSSRVSREHRLPSGVIADVFTVSIGGDIAIYEVKTGYKSSLIANAQQKYAHWCNRLYVAIPHLTLDQVEEESPVAWWRNGRETVGLIGIYRDALATFRVAHRSGIDPRIYELITKPSNPS
jgi:hypothetical protein